MYRELPEWAQDAIHVNTEVRFGFVDRLKILFGYRMSLDAMVSTAAMPGRTETVTELRVWRPYWQRQVGMVTEA